MHTPALKKAFIFILAVLCVIGLIMVYSSSYLLAREIYGAPTYFFYKQIFFLSFGLLLGLTVSKIKITFWLKVAPYFQFIIFALILLTLIPGFGAAVKGANRWIQFGPVNLQPGEFVKLGVLLNAPYFFENYDQLSLKEKWIRLGIIFLPMLALIKQPDFGSFAISLFIFGFMAFISSFSRKKLFSLIGLLFVSGVIILISEPYRIKRLTAYLDPWKNSKTTGFQIIQSLLGFANGSFFGLGLGNGNEKLFYLPEAHNDFIFSVLAEELGFVGVTALILLFVAFIYLGFKIALSLRDKYCYLLASTIIFSIGLQALINMSVVLGLLPTKGLNLPFVSYGGSSMVSNFLAIGVFFSCAKFEDFSTERPFKNSNTFNWKIS